MKVVATQFIWWKQYFPFKINGIVIGVPSFIESAKKFELKRINLFAAFKDKSKPPVMEAPKIV